jgi:hypothetical protein
MLRITNQTVLATIFLVTPVEMQMSVSYQSMVGNVGLCDFGQEWSWILCKRMECETVNNSANDRNDGTDEEEGNDK